MFYTVIPTKNFEGILRRYARRFPKVLDDVEEILEELEKGNLLGDDIAGLALQGNKVFKVRVKNSSSNKGKSGGFRLIYYLVTSDQEIVDIKKNT